MLYSSSEGQRVYFRRLSAVVATYPELAVYLKHAREEKSMLCTECEQCNFKKYALAAYGNRAQRLLCLCCGDHDLIF